MKYKITNNPEKYLKREDIEKGRISTSYIEKLKNSKIKKSDDFSTEIIYSNWYSKKRK